MKKNELIRQEKALREMVIEERSRIADLIEELNLAKANIKENAEEEGRFSQEEWVAFNDIEFAIVDLQKAYRLLDHATDQFFDYDTLEEEEETLAETKPTKTKKTAEEIFVEMPSDDDLPF